MSTLLLTLLAMQAADAQGLWNETRFHRIHLRNGNFVDGKLISNTSREEVVLEVRAGLFEVRRDLIERIEYVTMRSLKPAPLRPEAPKADLRDAEGKPEPSAPASLPPGPAAVRVQVDLLIADWKASRDAGPYELAPRLQALGPDAVVYACWLVEHRDEKTPVRDLLASVSGTGHPALMPALDAVARTGSPEEKAALVDTLESLGHAPARAILYRLVGSHLSQVWKAASESVIRLYRKDSAREAPDSLLSHLEREAEKTPYAVTLARLEAPESRRFLLDFARTADVSGRRAVLQGLLHFRSFDDAEIARPYLKDRAPELRRDACEFIGRLKATALVPDLIERLADESKGVAQTALWALRAISEQQFEPSADLWKRWWTEEGSQRAPRSQR